MINSDSFKSSNHSPPAHMALGYPYFPEILGTDGRTSQNYKRGSLLANLANINIYNIYIEENLNTLFSIIGKTIGRRFPPH